MTVIISVIEIFMKYFQSSNALLAQMMSSYVSCSVHIHAHLHMHGHYVVTYTKLKRLLFDYMILVHMNENTDLSS